MFPGWVTYSAAGKYVDQSWEYINGSQMKVDIGTEAAQFLGKEYINGIFVAVWVAAYDDNLPATGIKA